MINQKVKYILVFLLFSAFVQPVLAAADVDDTRYFVQTTKGFWKNAFNVRHSFDDGFTADLSDWQLRVAKIAGLKFYPVKRLNILPADPVIPSPQPEELLLTGKGPQRVTPTEQVPWGVKMLYQDSTLGKSSGGAKTNVAVLDTGVFRDHLDLKNRIKECKDFSGVKGITDGKCEDRNGHGTHVAGIIAADGGSDFNGIYGVAPEANLFVYKVCSNNGSCWSDDIAVALRTAADNGVNVINLSLGADADSSLIFDAVAYAQEKGVLVVAAAGNDGPYQGSIDYPAANASVVAVGALDIKEDSPDWSSRGVNTTTQEYTVEDKDMEFAAPGVNIESTWKDGGYVILSGTSMAAPHVAGLAAKLWQKDATNPAQATRELLHTLAHDLFPLGDDDASGFGLPTL